MKWIFQNTKALLTAVLLIFTCSWSGYSQSIPGESLNTRFRIQIQAVGHGPQSGDLDSELEIVKQENKESVDSVVDKSANGDNELEDSVTYIGSGSSGYGNKNNGGTSGFFMSNILLFAGGFIVVILLIVLLNRLSVKREKKRIWKEDVKVRREWEKLLEDNKK